MTTEETTTADARPTTVGGPPPTDPSPPWEDLVKAALLGAERRTPPGGSPGALLALAAEHTVRQRAGLTPGTTAAQRPRPDGHDPRPPLPPAAAHRFTQLLDAALRTRYEGAGGYAAPRIDLGALLPEWLELAHARGYRPASHQLPALLGAARARNDLRATALAFGGPRARWLAGLRPAWSFALRETAQTGAAAPAAAETDAPAPGAGPPTEEEAQEIWQEGLFTERVALLTALRRRDPAAARTMLAGSWRQERAEDRLLFLDTLREGLGTEDEHFLESALGDRSKTVRAGAAELLSLLPESALARRMAERGRGCVTLDPGGSPGQERLRVYAPRSCDDAMRRDGVVAKPPVGHGDRSWWLTQVVEAAPLDQWSEHFGGRSPEEIVALPVEDDWRADLHVAWSRAAARQQHTVWARALLGRPAAPVAEAPERAARLLSMLPAGERAAWAAEFITHRGLGEAFRILNVCPGPWPEPLAEVVLGGLREAGRLARAYPSDLGGVLSLAERCLDPTTVTRLETPEPSTASRGTATDRPVHDHRAAYWGNAFTQLAETLQLRADFRAELQLSAP